MFDNYNPFKDNRAEQMKELWKYYVPFPGLNGGGKPLVVEGGRGSGKTMFFQCNSWREKLSQIRKNGNPITDLIDKEEFIGIYYRVDTTFVSSMRDRDEDNWGAVFETYLCLCLLKEVIGLLLSLSNNMKINETLLTSFIKTFSKRLYVDSVVDTLFDFQLECNTHLDAIEDKINGKSNLISDRRRFVNAHRFLTDLCVAFSQIVNRENLLFKIFIDEYETLQEYQQKIVNTLIKHSTLPVVFNIGLRPKGMKTAQTISETETIESPHDFEHLYLGFDEENYPQIIKDICRIRIALGKEQGRIPQEASEDIEFYLKKYSIDYELGEITNTPKELPHIKKLLSVIEERGIEENLTEEEIREYCDILCNNADVVNSRIHYALLCKKTKYTPKIKELVELYTSNEKRYKEWVHNRKHGAVYLLCKESKREKLYYGFDVYLALSSNIVRYFLELCERAFDFAFLNGYKWDTYISEKLQTDAAVYVSEYKVDDISGCEPYGKELRIFTQYLGQIFYKLHTEEDTTLGEPEPNHFNTKDLSLSEDCKKLISSCVMWNVLQEGEPTKRKQSRLSPETVDYYLNRIYIPYFGISYRDQRKIQIDVDVLKDLFSGDEKKAKQAFRRYFKEFDSDDEQLTFDNWKTGG